MIASELERLGVALVGGELLGAAEDDGLIVEHRLADQARDDQLRLDREADFLLNATLVLDEDSLKEVKRG